MVGPGRNDVPTVTTHIDAGKQAGAIGYPAARVLEGQVTTIAAGDAHHRVRERAMRAF